MMSLETLEQAFMAGGAPAVFADLERQARADGNYRLLFHVRLMKARHELKLPLWNGVLPNERVEAAALEAGEQCLSAGDIPAAWPYFKAIGRPEPVADAIEHLEDSEHMDQIIEIALSEGVHPRRGFELILQHHGICRAITAWASIGDRAARQHCLALLVRALYRDLVKAIGEAAGCTDEPNLASLIRDRDWLFEGPAQYADSTHLASILRYALELEDDETLRMAAEMAEYGQKLDPLFHFRGDPPFEDIYRDHAIYFRARLGERVDEAIAHFRSKLGESFGAAEVLIDLLSRADRQTEAIDLALEYAPDSAIEICQQAGDYARVREIGKARGDALTYAAGLIQSA